MVVVLVILLVVMMWALARLFVLADERHDGPAPSHPSGAARGRATVRPTSADRVQDRWTALDDLQLARLLDDAPPC